MCGEDCNKIKGGKRLVYCTENDNKIMRKIIKTRSTMLILRNVELIPSMCDGIAQNRS